MSHPRKPIGSPCALCGEAVADESASVHTLSRTLPYIPKLWHRLCYEQQRAAQRPIPRQGALVAA